MKPLVFLNSHPIQYFAPLYKEINEKTNIDLTVWYCSDESIRGELDKGFGTSVKWDIPLLNGYKYLFLKNYSWKKSIYKGFFGLLNIGVVRKLFSQPRSVIIIHGWAYSTHILTIIFGKMAGHKICLRAETPYNQELMKNRFKTTLKNTWLRFLFLFIDEFLYIGIQNKAFFRSLKVDPCKLRPMLYCVDNDRFRDIFLSTEKQEARNKLNLPAQQSIFLYSGKYIEKKRPLDLLKAFNELNNDNSKLIFVGDGELRPGMEEYIIANGLQHKVILTGFINQSEIAFYYRAADTFIMCSGRGETWGLSVNEAMNFGLPVIVSDTCGCAVDLVDEGVNGNIFETGNIDQLKTLLSAHLQLSEKEKFDMANASFKKIDQYSYQQNIEQLKLVVA